MDLVGQNDPCHLLEDKKGCQVNEQEQTEAMLIEKGTRTAMLTTVLHKHFKHLPKDAFKIPTRVSCLSSKTWPISHPQPSKAGCLPGQQPTLSLPGCKRPAALHR